MKPATRLFCGLLLGASLVTEGLLAAEWQREAGVSLRTYYSDNICLSDDDHVERGGAMVTPNLQVNGQGDRGNLSLNAAVTYDSLADSSLECETGQRRQLTNRESVIPSLRYLGDFELIEDWLTLESDAFIGRNPIDPFAAGRIDQFNGRDNVNITYQYGAGATLQRRLFDSADMRLRVYHNEQYNRVNQIGDSSEDRGEFDLGTERSGNRLTVGVAGRYSEVTFDSNGLRPAFVNTLSSAEVRAALRLSSSWEVNALVGEDWNEFISYRSDIEGSYWDAGLRWTPNERVEVALGTGERFFGSTPRASIRYQNRRNEVTADYARSVTFPRNLRAPALDPDDPFGLDFGLLPSDPLYFTGDLTFIGNTPIINERLSVRYRYSARRTGITISASDSRQLRLEDAGEADFSSLGLIVTRSLAANLTGNFRVSWNETDGRGNGAGFFGQHSEWRRAGVGVERRLGNSTTISLGYDHINADSDDNRPFFEFEENRVTLTLRYQF
jgi:hypothetical protein